MSNELPAEGTEPPKAEDEQAQQIASLRRRFSLKVGFTLAGVFALVIGATFSLLFLYDFNSLIEWLRIEALIGWLQGFVTRGIERLGMDAGSVASAFTLSQFVMAAIINTILFVLALILALVLGWKAGKEVASRGEFSGSGLWCLGLTRNSLFAGLFEAFAGVVLVASGVYFLLNYFGFAGILYGFPALVGCGLALIGVGIATCIRVGYFLDPPQPFEEDGTGDIVVPAARATGKELLELLRASPIYRRQVYCERVLGGFGFAEDKEEADRKARKIDALSLLKARYPRVASVLPHTGIERLTVDQAKALKSVLVEESKGRDRSVDYVFVGWPGSGRSTLANLLALSGILHREGAMYCVAGENPALGQDLPKAGATGRTTPSSSQIQRWLTRAGLTHQVRIEKHFEDDGPEQELDLRNRPDVVLTDVRTLSQAVLTKVRGDARELIARLRYVIIDQPDRLEREDLIRLRLAIARLRMSAELMGRAPTFILILPPLDNYQEFAKFLLNNDRAPFHHFIGWPGDCDLVGWVPPLELLDFDNDERPKVVRSAFSTEVVSLLTEIGYLSNRLEDSLKVAIVDPKPLLGPEAREHIRTSVLMQLGAGTQAGETFKVSQNWTYLGTQEIVIDHPGEFDVIVSLGIGGHPTHLVSSLRPALAHEGALILVADSSPLDLESMRVVGDPSWDPFRALQELRLPSLVVPNHSEAVIAHEMAGLFEDFQDRPLPLRRLLGIFPGEHTLVLLHEWEGRGRIDAVDVFATTPPGERPQVEPCLRRADPTFGGDQYMIPWGCCSRRILEVYDRDARSTSVGNDRARRYLDYDRLFIDFHPYAVRRTPPYTVKVDDCLAYEVSVEEQEAGRRRMVVQGRIDVVALGYQDAIQIDRRAPVIEVELASERPLDPDRTWNAPVETAGRLMAHPILDAFRVDPEEARAWMASRRGSDVDKTAGEWRMRLVDGLQCPTLTTAGVRPRIHVGGGMWTCRIRETLRDVMCTDGRLVEEPFLVQSLDLPRRLRLSREYECLGVSLFFADRSLRVSSGPDGKDAPPALPGGSPLGDDDPAALLGNRPAIHALARALRLQLACKYINFDDELRIAVLPNIPRRDATAASGQGGKGGDRTPGLADSYRILFYGLHGDELSERHSLQWLLEAPKLQALLQAARLRLQGCDCDDGCSQCCGGLGTIPVHELPWAGFAEDDAISRKGAYSLVCCLLGVKPDWTAYTEGQRRRRRGAGTQPPTPPVPVTDAELARLLEELLGTETNEFQDGVWTRLFGDRMVLSKDMLATATWDPALGDGIAGLYTPARKLVSIRPDQELDRIKETIIHEFAHNWQHEGGEFDIERLRQSAEARQYFEGKLVIEGHATWSDNQFRFHLGLGPEYTPQDDRNWNEYKVGYFLFEGIEKAVGQAGLFAWIRRQSGDGEPVPVIRSRNPQLQWPFTLRKALEVLGLERAARTGRFTRFDVPDPPGPEAPTAQPPASP